MKIKERWGNWLNPNPEKRPAVGRMMGGEVNLMSRAGSNPTFAKFKK
jgi:hypothetical protein